MDRINTYALYELAGSIRPIGYVYQDMVPDDLFRMVSRAMLAVEPFLSSDPPYQLSLSHGALKTLYEALNDLRIISYDQSRYGASREVKLGAVTTQELIPAWKVLDARNALSAFETLLSAECAREPSFRAPKRGIYDSDDLVNSASMAVPAALRAMLPDKAISDMESAGRCLAFGLFTASGFHLCRAVEALIEVYYQRFCGKAGTLRSWHDYIKALEAQAQVSAPPVPGLATIEYLKQMKDSDRNPISHPRVILDEAEACILFASGQSLIGRMLQELSALGPTSVAATNASAP
ncbi:MAG: hypothetical protein AB7I59_26955 [Geminicoccaceae bacterium]